MPDWLRETSRKLAGSKFSAGERDDVARELATYLDDLCTDARSLGLDERAATPRAFTELHHDAGLGSKLYRARKENSMHLNERTKHFWLPGTTTLFASAGCLAILQFAGVQADFEPLWLHGGAAIPNSIYLPLAIYWPWLCFLPFFGAASAYWSRRAGGSKAVQTAAGFFTAFVFFAILLMALVSSFIIGGLTGDVPVGRTLFLELIGALVSWVVIPALALLLGVLPFLGRASAPGRSIGAAV